MTWFKVDDKLSLNAKIRAVGCEGLALWLMAGTMCASVNGDGLVPAQMARDAAYLAGVDGFADVSARLVKAKLWHDSKSIKKCDDCSADAEAALERKLAPGELYIHQWSEWQLSKTEAKDVDARRKYDRNKALKNDRALCALIQARDGTHCRYCSERVNWKDRRGPLGATYDHVDPDAGNDIDNVVVACRRCNGRKRDRTPEEAGMVLHPPPGKVLHMPGRDLATDLAQGQVQPGSGPEKPEIPGPEPGQDLASRARYAQDGSGQVGSGQGQVSGQVPGQVGPDREQDGDGSAEAGSEQDGSGQGPADFPTETHLEGESA